MTRRECFTRLASATGIAIAGAALLETEACSASVATVLGYLDAVDNAVAAALPAFMGVPALAAFVPAIEAYLSSVSTFCEEVAGELASSDTTADKAQRILADAVTLAVPFVPNPTAQAIVNAVAKSVDILLQSLGLGTQKTLSPTPQARANATPHVSLPTNWWVRHSLSTPQKAHALTLMSHFASYKAKVTH